MAAAMDDLISIKLQLGDETRRLKLPLKELTPSSLPLKVIFPLLSPSHTFN